MRCLVFIRTWEAELINRYECFRLYQVKLFHVWARILAQIYFDLPQTRQFLCYRCHYFCFHVVLVLLCSHRCFVVIIGIVCNTCTICLPTFACICKRCNTLFDIYIYIYQNIQHMLCCCCCCYRMNHINEIFIWFSWNWTDLQVKLEIIREHFGFSKKLFFYAVRIVGMGWDSNNTCACDGIEVNLPQRAT